MKTEDYNFPIPDRLIAQYPSQKRSESRLLVYYRNSGKIVDSHTKNLSDFLTSDDFLVFNNSKVFPARFKVKRADDNRAGEIVILKIVSPHEAEVITDKSKKYPPGTEVIMPDGSIITVVTDKKEMVKKVTSTQGIFTNAYFDQYGLVPLPPYIRDAKPEEEDRERYQTVYSKIYGSAAAPTAGLHFDDHIFKSFQKKGIDYAFVSLHVGLGTFQPIYSDVVEEHKIHREEYDINTNDAEKIDQALIQKKRIIPVGTTSLRTLETAYTEGHLPPGKGSSELYIYPGYQFKITNGLMTNFHTPRSTLLVLVSALIGYDELKRIYAYAVNNEYRFFSYGDAMLIL